jgi:hypothetical protein
LGGMRPVPDGCYIGCTRTRSVEALKLAFTPREMGA